MRILLVEDTHDLSDAIASHLGRRGYTVVAASDGEAADRSLMDDTFDIVVLDINLPKRNGFAILRDLRGRRDRVPVLVITARSEIDDKVSLLDLGADDYLVKPFDLRELEARIRALLRRPLGLNSTVVKVGDIVMDVASRTLVVGGDPIDLGRREFRLLEVLFGRLGMVVQKDTLMDRLFAADEEVAPNAVELYVSRLRKKLGDCAIEIVTVRGEGYVARPKPGAPA